MNSLTQREKLAVEALEWHGRPGHVLVVYRKRNGLELRDVLPEGKGFRPSLLDRMFEFVVYAVTTREDLRYAFQRVCHHVDGVHSYVLHCTLTFRIEVPEKLTAYLDQDPLQLVENEAERLFTATTRSMPWQFVAQESREFKHAASYSDEDHDQVIRTNLEILQNFASRLGISVASVAVFRSLPDEDDTVASGKVKAGGNVTLTQALVDREIFLVSKGTEVAGQIAQDEVRSAQSFEDFTLRDRKVRETNRQSETLFLNTDSPRTAPALTGASTTGTFLPQQNDSSIAGLSSLLEQVLTVLNAVSIDSPERRALGSGLLHLVAEAFQGYEADVDILNRYTAIADQASQDLMKRNQLGGEPRRLIHNLLNTDTLVRRLS